MIPLKIQYFGGGVQTTLTPGLSDENKTFYEKALIRLMGPKLIYDRQCQKKNIPPRNGKEVEFRCFDPLPKALEPLQEGVTPDPQGASVHALTATVQQYGGYIPTSDILEWTAIDPVLNEFNRLIASQAARTLDTISRDVMCAGTNKMFAPAVNAVTGAETEVLLREDVSQKSKLTGTVVRHAVNRLERMDAEPFEDGFHALIHPDVADDLRGDNEWLDAHKYAKPEEIFNGEIGTLHGVKFFKSSEAKIIGPANLFGTTCRMTLKTELNGGGSTDIYPNQQITSEQAKELTEKISAGTVTIYVGGNECNVQSVTAGAPGTAKLVVDKTIKNVPVGGVICGAGAGKDGSAIYCSLFLAKNACGTTSLENGGLEYIAKPKGSGEDPLNQRSTIGWKATKVTERLVEAYMIRVEHSTASFGAHAVSN